MNKYYVIDRQDYNMGLMSIIEYYSLDYAINYLKIFGSKVSITCNKKEIERLLKTTENNDISVMIFH